MFEFIFTLGRSYSSLPYGCESLFAGLNESCIEVRKALQQRCFSYSIKIIKDLFLLFLLGISYANACGSMVFYSAGCVKLHKSAIFMAESIGYRLLCGLRIFIYATKKAPKGAFLNRRLSIIWIWRRFQSKPVFHRLRRCMYCCNRRLSGRRWQHRCGGRCDSRVRPECLWRYRGRQIRR
ncbi:hypothetical protein STH12_01922 [Shewanella khirikhana]|uniref:Uncharacterized protein n=1 Tax=Shewanella khirikhana TaxID=1965282 RepID=A0ABM7DNQ0_9GAMM|nr:hypothetical protein STH12_01922 [Shewanella khirikhana]